MLPGAAESKALPMVSGLGLAFGNFAGVLVLVLLIVANEQSEWVKSIPGGVGSLSGLVVAIWMVIFIIPFFILMPEHKGSMGKWSTAFQHTFSRETFQVRGNAPVLSFLVSLIINPFIFVRDKFIEFPNVMRYLLARMIYADGTAVLFAMAGVYVAGVLKFSATEIMLYGITGSLFGAMGGFLGARLDRWLGPKRALIIELSIIIGFLILQVSITDTSLLFGLIDGTPIVWDGPVFQTLSKMTYELLVIPAAIIIVAAISSSRYMLVHISPPDRIGEFYGFYSMAGSVTVWIAPIVVA
jgi:UMF1 family MFS transporter